MEISFIYPAFLLFLLLIPVFIFIYFFHFAITRKRAVVFSNYESIEKIAGIEIFSRNLLMLCLNLAILILLVFAVAGTVISFNANTSSSSYVIAIDNSDSMRVSDVLPTRLDAAKSYAKDFADFFPLGAEFGVVAFSGDSKIVQELETSKIKTKLAIDSIDFDLSYGTNIYSAVISAGNLLEKSRMKSILLLSDGQFSLDDVSQIVKYAVKNNIVINKILIGAKEGGNSEFDVVLKPDEGSLLSLASGTGGKFFRFDENYKSSFSNILEKTNTTVSINISFYLLIAVLILFLIDWILYNFRFGIFP